MELYFDHEKLTVYQRSIEFVTLSSCFLESILKTASAHNQLERAATSIPLNIAEGNGKWTPKDRCRYFDSARGSALECAAALDVAVAKGFIARESISDGKELLREIVRMLVGLIKANDKDREFGVLQEEEVEYVTMVNRGESGGDQEQD